MVRRTIPAVPASEARRIRKVATPVVAPVTRSDREVAEMRAKLEALSKRNSDANKRLRVHLMFIVSGMVITVALSFIPVPPAVHFGGIAAGMPGAIQEAIDWIRGW